MKRYPKVICCLLMVVLINLLAAGLVTASAEDADETLMKEYLAYYERFDTIKTEADIPASGFRRLTEESFAINLQDIGEAYLTPLIDEQYRRIALLVADESGNVIYKTDRLSTNYQKPGQLEQPNRDIAALSFQDVNDDQLTDILMITFCEGIGETRNNGAITYKVGDVLFQDGSSGKQAFYRDYRISDRINQYGMNKSIRFIVSYLTGGYSTEFLYTALTMDQLLENGFMVSSDYDGWREFEKWGRVRLLAGTYRMAEYHVFMIYLVNEQGYIVWSFQPMEEYESLYSLRGLRCVDIDGDGMKDIVVLARYISENEDNESVLTDDYAIYYQRTNEFITDKEVKKRYQCSSTSLLDEVVKEARIYWGWNQND